MIFPSCLLPSRPLPTSISGVISIPLSVVLGVEEDQSESAPAHAWYEGGAHHPALGAHQADQENDRWDYRMSTKAAKRNVEEEISWDTLKHKQKKPNHSNELLHFTWTILRGGICSPVFFHRSTWCKILRYWLTTRVVLARTRSRVTVYVRTHRCHWTAVAGTTVIWTMDSPPSCTSVTQTH